VSWTTTSRSGEGVQDVQDEQVQTPGESDFGGRTVRGALVSTGGQFLRLGIQIAGIAILARLLDPADYGLVAMASVLVTFGEIFREFGLSAAAVQSRTLSRVQRNGLFWANTALGLVLALAACVIAYPLSWFFGQPEVVHLAQAMSLIFVLNGATAQYRASLTRSLRFARIAGADIAAQAIGLAAGVAAALAGWGYWSLAVMQLSLSGSSLLLLGLAAGWLPGRPRRGAGLGGFWRYGRGLVAAQLVTYAGANADKFALGYLLGPAPLGLYDRAYRLVNMPLAQMRGPLTTVALPVLSRLQDEQERYVAALLRGQAVLGYTIIPTMAVLAGASTPVVAVVMGDRWLESGPILGALAVAGALQLLAYVGYWVYLSRALTTQLFHFTMVSVALRIACIIVGSFWGAFGIAVGVAVASGLQVPVSIAWLSRVGNVPFWPIMRGAIRAFVMAVLAGVAAWSAVQALVGAGSLAQLAGAGAAALGVYLLGLLIPSVRADVMVLVGLAKVARQRA
jgi:PST family polysaccharide transporter